MIPWPEIVLRLKGNHQTHEVLSREVGSCPRHLARLVRGEVKEPKFSVGLRLLDMHYDRFPEYHRRIKL